jgi:D-aminopeptidase
MIRIVACLLLFCLLTPGQPAAKKRARQLGIVPGAMPAGSLNAITDVEGVHVGHATLIEGDNIRTGVTVILPHERNLFQEKVPAAIEVFNGFGKLAGYTQVRELGEIEAPIALTSTLNVPLVTDAIIEHMLALPGNENVRSINVVVGETNDGGLNDIRRRPVRKQHVETGLRAASAGTVPEGAVGAGTGTRAFGFKGGIGTSSRKTADGYTIGVLVQSNFGGDLRILGIPVARELRQRRSQQDSGDGSLMIVIATDAPLTSQALSRLARRSFLGMALTGSSGSNGSGDYAIAFTTNRASETLHSSRMSPLFRAVIEATEEAIYNSMFMARTVTSTHADGSTVTAPALPVDEVLEILRYHRVLR